MSILAFEPGEVTESDELFRGRSLFFWKQRIFKDIIPFDPVEHENTGSKPFNFLIIFDPQRFLLHEADLIEEIFDELLHRDPEKENIISIEGKPFFAVSHGSFLKLRLNLKSDKEVATKLRNNGNVRIFVPKQSFFVLDSKRDLLAIESSIIAFQAASIMAGGAILEDMGNFFLEGMIPIGPGSRLSSGVVIKGESKIGQNVRIYPHCYIENSTIGDNCTLLPGSILTDSVLEENVQVGPYAHLRNGALVKKGAKMGNFVEMKKSTLGSGSKSMHLTYIGDAEIGEHVNIGAGTITCNYDGVNKHKTTIEDGVFIGSGTELVAPVTIRKNSYVAAGSTITEEVPENSLAVARQRQRNILGWAERKKKKNPAIHK